MSAQDHQVELVAIVGSLRRASVNAAVARAAAGVATAARVTMHDISDLPFYDGDTEAAGLPEPVERLNRVVGAAEGLLLFSPEYNSSLPAVTKNVIDWLSRPPKVWDGLPVGLVAATPGQRAGLGVREHFTTMLDRRPMRVFETLGIGSYGDKLDADGELTDPETLIELADYVDRFAQFCRDGAE
ncbi:NADPH-dependent FMN reductase [Ilumatobacter sp.]|uniref:NADPH-dependent FMN reductase n=1 Tax=Ilumatobacter sp. TaxID=1967498 RepID=UPI003AF86EF2